MVQHNMMIHLDVSQSHHTKYSKCPGHARDAAGEEKGSQTGRQDHLSRPFRPFEAQNQLKKPLKIAVSMVDFA